MKGSISGAGGQQQQRCPAWGFARDLTVVASLSRSCRSGMSGLYSNKYVRRYVSRPSRVAAHLMRTDPVPVPELLVHPVSLGDVGSVPAPTAVPTRPISIVAVVGVARRRSLPLRRPNEVQPTSLQSRVSPNDGHSNRSPKLSQHDWVGTSLPIRVDQRRDGP